MLTLLAFLVAIGLLVAVHEYGHYRVAVACGVKVLRFSVGFGKPLWSWRSPRSGTEYVLGALPLGGYVRMLDEREAAVPAAERHLAFNTQSLRVRTAIVAAGPAANLLLAVLLYALVAWMGVPQPQPVLSTPAPASLAERAGVRGGEWVVALAREGDAPQPIESFGDLRWQLTRAALAQQDLKLWLASGPGEPGREVRLELSQVDVRHADATLMRQIGIEAPWSAPLLGQLTAEGAAAAAGLQPGDRVLRVDGQPVRDAAQLRQLIRLSAADGQPRTQRWHIERAGRVLELEVTPRPEQIERVWVGRIGGFVGATPDMAERSAGPLEGLWQGSGAHLGGFAPDAANDRQDAQRPSFVAKSERPDHHRRLRRPVGGAGAHQLPVVSGADQRQPRGAQPAAAAGARRRAPDVLSVGGRDRAPGVQRLDGGFAAHRYRAAAGPDVAGHFQ